MGAAFLGAEQENKRMIEQIVSRKNLLKARKQVEKNKGSSGVDGMPVSQLKQHLDLNRDAILTSILNDSYIAQPILGVVIPKGQGKTRQLGVPTVTDRMLQQAVSQVIAPKFETVRRCDGVQRPQLRFSTQEERPPSGATSTEVHQ